MTQRRILIVDDDDCVRDALFDELCGSYDVVTASSGEEAIDVISSSNYDAVISDLRMPGINGITVLDHVRDRQPDAVRILLTGFYDDHARQALRQRDAPFKIGKPWHDEVEITLNRAFELQETTRCAADSMQDAIALINFDDELGTTQGLLGMCRMLAARILRLHGVQGCVVTVEAAGTPQVVSGNANQYQLALADAGWLIDEQLINGTQIRACGEVGASRHLAISLIDRARSWAHEDRTTRLARKATVDDRTRSRLRRITRWASLGTMTSALMHDIASAVQGLQCAMVFFEDAVDDAGIKDGEVGEAVESVTDFSRRLLTLFHAMRGFVRSGKVVRAKHNVRDLVAHAITLSKRRSNSLTFQLNDTKGITFSVNEPLLLQVMVNLLRNAAAVSPTDGTIDITISADDDFVEISLVDDGPGVPQHIVDELFEPFCSHDNEDEDGEGTGLGLSISSEIVKYHGGTIRYQREPGRGARFTVVLPRHSPAGDPFLDNDSPR